jgi:tripartite-type tricarboxylate transporter receptor subunit TctC
VAARATRAGRDCRLPEEQGIAGLDASAWHGLFLPKGTPAEIVKRLNAAAAAALDSPKVQEQLATQGAILPAKDRRSPEALKAFVKRESSAGAAPSAS